MSLSSTDVSGLDPENVDFIQDLTLNEHEIYQTDQIEIGDSFDINQYSNGDQELPPLYAEIQLEHFQVLLSDQNKTLDDDIGALQKLFNKDDALSVAVGKLIGIHGDHSYCLNGRTNLTNSCLNTYNNFVHNNVTSGTELVQFIVEDNENDTLDVKPEVITCDEDHNNANMNKSMRNVRDSNGIQETVGLNIEKYSDTETISLDPEILTCEYCELEFVDHGDLNDHVQAQHLKIENEGLNYECEACSTFFATEKEYHDHNALKHKELKLKCKICHRRFAKESDIVYHFTYEHKNTEILKEAYTVLGNDRTEQSNNIESRDQLRAEHSNETRERLSRGMQIIPKRSRLRDAYQSATNKLEQKRCRVCREILTNSSLSLEKHRKCVEKLNTEKVPSQNTCKVCNGIMDAQSLSKHRKCFERPSLTDTVPSQNKCRVCDQIIDVHTIAQHRKCFQRRIEPRNPEGIVCKKCGAKFKTLGGWERHKTYCKQVSQSFHNKPFKCKYCLKHFSKKSMVMRHASLAHKSNKNTDNIDFINEDPQTDYSTDVSEMSHSNTSDKSEYAKEKSYHKITKRTSTKDDQFNTETHNLPTNQSVCIQKRKLSHTLNHLEEINDIELQTCAVALNEVSPENEKSFKEKPVIEAQEKQNENVFACAPCDRTFVSEGNLKRHLARHQMQKPTLEKNEKQTLEKPAIETHEEQNENGFKCALCDKTFVSAGNLKIHVGRWCLKRHSEVQYIENPSLETQKKQNDNVFECVPCDRTFISETNLKRHIARHEEVQKPGIERHEEQNEDVFQSVPCDRAFISEANLKRYTAKHREVQKPDIEKQEKHNDDVFECAPCDRKFISEANLRRHLERHQEVQHSYENKPFKCKICLEYFEKKTDVVKHVKDIHKNKYNTPQQTMETSNEGEVFNSSEAKTNTDQDKEDHSNAIPYRKRSKPASQKNNEASVKIFLNKRKKSDQFDDVDNSYKSSDDTLQKNAATEIFDENSHDDVTSNFEADTIIINSVTIPDKSAKAKRKTSISSKAVKILEEMRTSVADESIHILELKKNATDKKCNKASTGTVFEKNNSSFYQEDEGSDPEEDDFNKYEKGITVNSNHGYTLPVKPDFRTGNSGPQEKSDNTDRKAEDKKDKRPTLNSKNISAKDFDVTCEVHMYKTKSDVTTGSGNMSGRKHETRFAKNQRNCDSLRADKSHTDISSEGVVANANFLEKSNVKRNAKETISTLTKTPTVDNGSLDPNEEKHSEVEVLSDIEEEIYSFRIKRTSSKHSKINSIASSDKEDDNNKFPVLLDRRDSNGSKTATKVEDDETNDWATAEDNSEPKNTQATSESDNNKLYNITHVNGDEIIEIKDETPEPASPKNIKTDEYKKCFVKNCLTDNILFPAKYFFRVPHEDGMRIQWYKAAKAKYQSYSDVDDVYCCEDHFDLEEDATPRIVNGKLTLNLSPDVVPHYFDHEFQTMVAASSPDLDTAANTLRNDQSGSDENDNDVTNPTPMDLQNNLFPNDLLVPLKVLNEMVIDEAFSQNSTKSRSTKRQSNMKECKLCGKMLGYKSMHEHMKNVHGGESVQCRECHKTFTSERYLKRHVNYQHKGVLRAYDRKTPSTATCDECGKQFKNQDCLTHHQRNCHSPTVECDICHSKLRSRSYLVTHMRRVHSVHHSRSCRMCGKVYRSIRQLYIHIRKSHPETMMRCEICLSKFHTQQHLNAHTRKCYQSRTEVESLVEEEEEFRLSSDEEDWCIPA